MSLAKRKPTIDALNLSGREQENYTEVLMPKYIITVAFVVEAEDMEHWNAEFCAVDFVKHRIDEGYRMDEQIESWDLVSVEKMP